MTCKSDDDIHKRVKNLCSVNVTCLEINPAILHKSFKEYGKTESVARLIPGKQFVAQKQRKKWDSMLGGRCSPTYG